MDSLIKGRRPVLQGIFPDGSPKRAKNDIFAKWTKRAKLTKKDSKLT